VHLVFKALKAHQDLLVHKVYRVYRAQLVSLAHKAPKAYKVLPVHKVKQVSLAHKAYRVFKVSKDRKVAKVRLVHLSRSRVQLQHLHHFQDSQAHMAAQLVTLILQSTQVVSGFGVVQHGLTAVPS
jgi:hypothetical protein